MDVDRVMPGIIGAIVGVIGWLFVGVYMQRRQFGRQAKNAGRAVYFELLLNRMNIVLARDYESFLPLGRSAFDRLLPELATTLPAASLMTMVGAYMGQAAYAQAATQLEAPAQLRRLSLDAIEMAHRAALDVLRPLLFSAREASALANLGGPYGIGVVPELAPDPREARV